MIITGEYWIRTLRENECEILNQSFDVMMLEEVLGEIVADPEQKKLSVSKVFSAVYTMVERKKCRFFSLTKSGTMVLSPVQLNYQSVASYLVMTDHDAVFLQQIMIRVLQLEEAKCRNGLDLLQRMVARMPDLQEEGKEEPAQAESQTDLSEGAFALLAQYVRPIEELELSQRTYNCLRNGNIRYVGDLVTKNDRDLLKIKNLGRGSLGECKNVLGLSLETVMSVEVQQAFEKALQPPSI